MSQEAKVKHRPFSHHSLLITVVSMCGITGWANLDPRTSAPHGAEELLRSMCERMIHRGPDSEGYLVDDGIALGMRRLAIIDLVTGEQPTFNEDRSIAVILYGEI